MKNYYRKLWLAVFLSVCLFGNAQTRQVNLTYKIISPTFNTEVTSPQELPVSFRLYNNGPDTLWPCDSFRSFIEHSINNSAPEEIMDFILSDPLFPEDSSNLFRDTTTFNWSGSENDIYVDLSLQVGKVGVDYTHPKGSPLNIITGDDGGVQRVQLIHRKTANILPPKSDREVVLFPNPTVDGKITVGNLGSYKVLSYAIYDISGIQIDKKLLTTENRTDDIEVNIYSKGLFIVTIQTDKGILSKKVIVVQ